jgi:hypothetical protein
MRLINEKVYASEHREQIKLDYAWAVRPDDLLQSLNRYRPQIVHFSGHGSKRGELLLVGREGFPQPVSVQALKAVFKTLKDNIRLVVLNACYSKTQAEAIRQEIECVVGMNDAIGDKAAITFSASFYRALGFGRSIQEAFEQGQTSLLLEGIAEDQTPELLVREGSDASQIFLLQPSASTTVSAPSQEPSESSTQQGFKLFFSYAHRDKSLRDELEKHLAILKRQKLIQSWYDQDINAGVNQQQEARSHLHAADIILLLISPDFIASDDLYNGELSLALVRHRRNEARVVPIILRDTEGWEQTEFGQLLALPRDLKPLTAWKNRDAAYSSIAKDIRHVIDELKAKQEKG